MVSFQKTFAVFSACIAIGALFTVWQLSDMRRIATLQTRQEANDITDFDHQWLRMQKWRVDWERMEKPCKGRLAWWDKEKFNIAERTEPGKSFISKWEIMPAGQFSRFFIQTVKQDGNLKKSGGDAWRVEIREGPASLAPQVWDHNNGIYEVLFLAMEPGNYSTQLVLEFTLCDGMRDPPKDWFRKGSVQGKNQRDGTLGYIGDDFILKPLQGKPRFNIVIPVGRKTRETHIQNHKKYLVNHGIACKLLHNGVGRWVNDSWLPYTGDSPTAECKRAETKAKTLWVYGDSTSLFLHHSMVNRGVCTEHFEKCKLTYLYIYKLSTTLEAMTKFGPSNFNKTVVLDFIAQHLDSPELQSSKSVFLFNLGVHYSLSLNFTTFKDLIDSVIELVKENAVRRKGNSPLLVYKTSTAIEEEKRLKKKHQSMNNTHWRFYTYQHLMLFDMYAMSAMCKAGIHVLDVYHMTMAYHTGTKDGVHYFDNVQWPAEDELVKFVTRKIKCGEENQNSTRLTDAQLDN